MTKTKFRKFSPDEIKSLIRSVDSHLTSQVEVILIGGSAAALAYKVTRYTQDIDIFGSIRGLKKAYEAAKKETGLDIPFEQAAVADAPYHYEDRLKEYRRIKLNKLKIFVPEIHDLILMKTVRAFAHDLETIAEMCQKNKVKVDVLIKRYINEMGHVVMPKNRLKLNFLAAIEAGFGESKALEISNQL